VEEHPMSRTKPITKKLFIEELERPAYAWGQATTLAVGEEGCKGGKFGVTTLAVGEEAAQV